MFDEDRTDDDKKTFCQVLTQLQLSSNIDDKSVHKIDLFVANQETVRPPSSHLPAKSRLIFQKQCPIDNPSTSKAFGRFKTKFQQAHKERLTGIDAREYADDEDVIKIYEEIAVTPPHVDEEYKAQRAERRAKRPERVAVPIPAIVVNPPEAASTATSAIPPSENEEAPETEDQGEEPASAASAPSPSTS